MKKILLINAFILLLCSSAFAQVKVAYMNPQRALEALPEYEAAVQQINTLVAQRDGELAEDANVLQSELAQYQQVVESLPQEQRTATETRLDSLNTAYNNKRQSFADEIQARRAQLLQPIITKVNQALEVIAKELGVDLVLNQTTSLGDSIIYYTSEDQKDITDLVIAKVLEQ